MTLALLLLLSCNRTADATQLRAADGAVTPTAACPATAKAGSPLPNTSSELESLAYWLGAAEPRQLDKVLLSERQLGVHDQAIRSAPDGSLRIVDLGHVASSEEVRAALDERLKTYAEAFAKGSYHSSHENAQSELSSLAGSFGEQHALHVALAPIDLSCVPFSEPIYSGQSSTGFDRNRCSQARVQEPIEILGKLSNMLLARTKNAFGFIAADSKLSPVVPGELEARYREPATLELDRETELGGQKLPAGTLLRSADAQTAWLASAQGFARSRALATGEVFATRRPLTRRSFLGEAFRYLRTPYGWGDENGGRDCSRFVLDVLAGFGVGMPRTSSHQAEAGRYAVEVPPQTSEVERLALLDEAQKRGVVLAQLPGHIMIYLGRDKAGIPRVLHSLAEYVEPCPGGGETVLEVGKVSVSDLSLGKGSSRKSLLERITNLTVFGDDPGYELLALSKFRATMKPSKLDPKVCKDSANVALFRSPREPDESRPLRVISVAEDDVRPASLWLVSPSGEVLAPEVHDLGVGPYARWIEQPSPTPGKWRALLADGDNVLACEEIKVAAAPKKSADKKSADKKSADKKPDTRSSPAPAWNASLSWQRDTEALYAAFVEQLFSHPVSDLRSWSSLTELLQKPERNLLFDHRGYSEDITLTLAPDCADLPYLLRAYFAWKMSLPFAFRTCSRGRAGAPPKCGEIETNEVEVNAKTELAAFHQYWRKLTNGVHSASGRTLPDDQESDLYPIPLTQRTLPPGTVYTDPYGHMIVVGKWLPQGLAGEGMMMGADAQPDATVGRRRFWRGNFLFTPDTRDVGAGFKRFRPIVRDPASKQLVAWNDAQIEGDRDFARPSSEQYKGTLDDFYVRMDQLIYPRPVDMLDRMRRVVDALAEQVERRVEAVDVGEAGMKNVRETVNMPDGYSIFETSGPWEDFATPSRDMRLLIAIDSVRAFPEQVRQAPQRFGVAAGSAELSKVDASLGELLEARHFQYTRSDGSKFDLTLADVVTRVVALETAYNPNDCPEARWGAVEGTPERSTCKRTASAEQRALLEKYRSWFHERARPARP